MGRSGSGRPRCRAGACGLAATPYAARRGGGGKGQPREPRLRPGTGGSAGRIGTGAPASLLAASGRAADGWAGSAGTAAGHGRRLSPLPRLRFGPSKPPGMTAGVRPAKPPRLRFGSSRRAGMTAGGKTGVFSGGSLVGGSPVRLRLGTNRGSRLRSRPGQVFGRRPHGHQPARPKFTAARSGAGAFGLGALGRAASGAGRSASGRSGRGRSAMGRSGTSRSGLVRFLRTGRFGRPGFGAARSGLRFGGARSGPRFGGPGGGGARLGSTRGGGRGGGRRFGGPRFGGSRSRRSRRSRPSAPRSGWMRSGGTGAVFRRSWLSGFRPRGGWSAIWRMGGRRTGGFR